MNSHNEDYEDSPAKQAVRDSIADTLSEFRKETGQPIVGLTLPGLHGLTEKTINAKLGAKHCSFVGFECLGEVFAKARHNVPSNVEMNHGRFPFHDIPEGTNFVYADLCGYPTHEGGNAKKDHCSRADDIVNALRCIGKGVVAVTFNANIRYAGGRDDTFWQMGAPAAGEWASPHHALAFVTGQYIVNKFFSVPTTDVLAVDLKIYMNGKHNRSCMYTLVFRINMTTRRNYLYPSIPLHLPAKLKGNLVANIVRYMASHPDENNYEVAARFMVTTKMASAIRVVHFRHGKFARLFAKHDAKKRLATNRAA